MRPFYFLLLAGLLACEHSSAASVDPEAPIGPLDPAEPTRLTYSGTASRPAPATPHLGGNREVAWSRDPSRILYAYGPTNPSPSPRVHGCIGDLPSAGGVRSLELCDREVARIDTNTTVEWPSMRDDGQIAFIRRRFGPFSRSPYYSDYAIQSTATGQVPRPVFTFPKRSPVDDRLVQGIAFPQWIDHDHLVALGRVIRRSPVELIQSGLDILLITPSEGEGGVTFVPGTHYASSVTLGATGDTIYYTMGGDSRVYRRALQSGVVDTIFDFAPLGIARDVRVAPDRLVAVVGGAVGLVADSLLGMLQVDSGGPVLHVRLSTGEITMLGETWDLWQHPVLSPDGSAVIMEQAGDLWRISLP